ncbi:hypothetical protein [Bacillus wiedmannii]|uniref:hypothetical protein n=1 Tax=Bacillus wiedmannii TaxID=1890302 RepID=UPI000CD9911E|nr:hypothetical protein [Bacillus wiedmannii]MBG9832136.1 hypothetical protein [Bacillus wiedmannii]UOB95749.1 hypothetical protein BTI679_30920 [Bacillus wiedmannii]
MSKETYDKKKARLITSFERGRLTEEEFLSQMADLAQNFKAEWLENKEQAHKANPRNVGLMRAILKGGR